MSARRMAVTAIKKDDFVAFEHYLKQCEINKVDKKGETLLHKAAREGNSKCILKLIEKGADVTKVRIERNGNHDLLTNALLMAVGDRFLGDADFGHPHIDKLTSEAYAALIHPSILHWTGSSYLTPLHLAAKYLNITAIQELLKAGADPGRKGRFGSIPLTLYLVSAKRNECINSEVISSLLPQHNMDPYVIVRYIHSHAKHLTDPTHGAELLARMLLSTKPDDYFSVHHSKDMCVTEKLKLAINISEQTICTPSYYLQFDRLYPICVILRKGLGAQTSPQCSSILAKYRAKGDLYPSTSTVEESNAKYEEAAEKAKKIDALFDECLSLFEQCCITIRRSIQTPKHEKLHMLGLPPMVLEQVTLLSFCRAICESIKDNR